ncbi:metallo-beta-lactamase superfamily protein [Aspergillus spinulosporus]
MALLNLPSPAGSTVDVSVMVGGHVTIQTRFIVKEQVAGHDTICTPSYSFLVENKARSKKILFDLGLPKAWEKKIPPSISQLLEESDVVIDVSKDVADQLREEGVSLQSIDAIVWSHHHFDHVGDPSVFPSSTALIVGPGFKSDKTTFPGYPSNLDAETFDDAFQGREVIELDFSSASMSIGGFPAIDYFGDGSFFLMSSEGHTREHTCALAHTSENEFIFLGGDLAHHAGEFRPTVHVPLPGEVHPSPLDSDVFDPQLPPLSASPGSVVEKAHPRKETYSGDYRTTPFYEASSMMNALPHEAEIAVKRLQDFDASAKVFVISAHDVHLQNIVPGFPQKLSNWGSAGYKSFGRWRFLRDFLNGVEEQRRFESAAVPYSTSARYF